MHLSVGTPAETLNVRNNKFSHWAYQFEAFWQDGIGSAASYFGG